MRFQQAADRNRQRGAVFRGVRICSQQQIPGGSAVLRQVAEEILAGLLPPFVVVGFAGGRPVKRDAENGPRLAAGPAGVIAVALKGFPVRRRTACLVKIEGMESGAVFAKNVVDARRLVAFSHFPIT